MTDFEKFKIFLDGMNIKYTIIEDFQGIKVVDDEYNIVEFKAFTICIDQSNMISTDKSTSLYIVFNDKKEFEYFEPM